MVCALRRSIRAHLPRIAVVRYSGSMRVEEQASTGQVLRDRERFVPRGVATPLVGRARRGRAHRGRRRAKSYIDFAGGIGCQNLGHGYAAVVRGDPRAGRPLPAPVLHGRHVRALRRGLPAARRALAVRGRRRRALLLNSGAEAVENAVKIARAATGRPASSASTAPSTAARS